MVTTHQSICNTIKVSCTSSSADGHQTLMVKFERTKPFLNNGFLESPSVQSGCCYRHEESISASRIRHIENISIPYSFSDRQFHFNLQYRLTFSSQCVYLSIDRDLQLCFDVWYIQMQRHYAHSLEGKDPDEWEPLETHLQAVAERARKFAEKFGAANWGRLLGLWHDIGKYSQEFQAYLLFENGFEAHLEQYLGRVNHSTAGAQIANLYYE